MDEQQEKELNEILVALENEAEVVIENAISSNINDLHVAISNMYEAMKSDSVNLAINGIRDAEIHRLLSQHDKEKAFILIQHLYLRTGSVKVKARDNIMAETIRKAKENVLK